MSSKKKFFLVFLFVLLDMFLLIGFLVIRDATMLNDLKKEINTLSKLEITKDRYNTKVKTKGNYGVVEKSIKNYLDDYAVSLQEVLDALNDEKLTKVLSYDNYKEDGPEFTKSLEYLNNKKETFNKKIDSLLDKSDEKTIKKYINDEIDDPYFRDLYVELMLTEERKDTFKETKDLLEESKTRINNVLDTSIDVLNFLKSNKDNWVLENGEIKFKNRDLYNQYMDKVSKLSK